MKITLLVIGSLFTAAMFSCSTEKPTEKAVVDSTAKEVTYKADTAASSVYWEGNMTGLKTYSHYGTVKLTEGTVTLKGLAVTAGSFTADLKSINPTDSGYSKEHPKAYLVGHLGGADFFQIDSFPTATFVITKVEGNVATGNLTLKGKTNEEKVTDIVVDTTGGTLKATGNLEFDRQKYGAAYKAAKDMLLADAIKLKVTLVANKQ